MSSVPRIAPARPSELGRIDGVVVRVLGAATDGDGPPHIFATLARHRRLFRPWLRFAGALMPGGRLPRVDSELLILRVAHNCGCDYEWHHHERIGQTAGLTAEQVAAVRDGADAPVFSPRQRLLLRAADALHADRDLPDELWDALRAELDEPQLIELPMLVGHYEMLAMTLNSLRVEPDPEPLGPPKGVARVAQRVLSRRSR